jgi:AbrB family looped-hinge helix DNA binding protein
MSRATIRSKGQLTIPADVRDAAHLEEGDIVEFLVRPEGVLLLPRKVIDATQAWFWTAASQAGELEASRQLQAGEGEAFESGDDFLRALEEDERSR